MRKRDRNVAVGTLIAAGIGYAAGVLTAPKSGKETRRDIQRSAIKAKKEAEAQLKKLHAELTDVIVKGQRRLSSLKSTSRAGLEQAIKKAEKAKTKVSEILSAIHEGEAEDKDLDKAIQDVKNAIEELKTYVKKTDDAK